MWAKFWSIWILPQNDDIEVRETQPRKMRCQAERENLKLDQATQLSNSAPWAREANFVKKPPHFVNVTYLELNGFNVSMCVSWSLSDPKKSQCIDRVIQIHQICVNKHKYENHIKFEVSLHFWPIWPTVRHGEFEPGKVQY